MKIIYQTTNFGWGLTAFFEGMRLVFSGEFKNSRIWKENARNFFGMKPKTPRQNPKSIVKNFDLYTLFSQKARNAWQAAYNNAKERKSPVCVEDIFLALIRESSVQNLFHRLKVSTGSAESFLNDYLKLTQVNNTATVKKVPFEAFAMAMKLHNHKVGSFMLLGALLNLTPEENILQAIFENIGLTQDKLEVFAVRHLNLNYEFPANSRNAKLLYCFRQAEILENHFGYFYEFPAIEIAVNLSQGQTLKDLEHKKAMQYLVKAGAIAKSVGVKNITEEMVRQAAAKK